MQRFYFLVKFGLVLIYILKVYRKKSSWTLLRKNMFNSLLAFIFWKACTFSRKSRNYSQQFSLEIFSWHQYFHVIPNVRSVHFGLCCIHFFFFLLFSFFFFFYWYFPWQTLTIHRIEGRFFSILFSFLLMQLSLNFFEWHCEDLTSYQTITLLLQS